MNEISREDEVFDVIVVGAGPAGSSAATAAASGGLRTLISTALSSPDTRLAAVV